MVTHHITVTVADDGTIRLPADAARPGETITVQIERLAPIVEPATDPAPGEPVRLTRLTAKTPEQKRQLLDEILRMGQETRARLPDEERTSNHDWLYDENGLPR